MNEVLEKELSPYRIIEREFRAITDKEDIKLIENAVNSGYKYKGVKLHLETALNLLLTEKNQIIETRLKNRFLQLNLFAVN